MSPYELNPYQLLIHEAEMVDYRVALLIAAVASPSMKRHSSLSALVLLDRDRHPIAKASLIADDRLNVAAVELLGVIKERRLS